MTLDFGNWYVVQGSGWWLVFFEKLSESFLCITFLPTVCTLLVSGFQDLSHSWILFLWKLSALCGSRYGLLGWEGASRSFSPTS